MTDEEIIIEKAEKDILFGASIAETIFSPGEWVFNGSSCLFFDFHHRPPNDVDIFVNVDRFSSLSAKLDKMGLVHDFSGNKMTIHRDGEKEIEVVKLADLRLDPGMKLVYDRLVPMRSSYMVMTDKMLLRQFRFKAQDMFDAAVFYRVAGKDMFRGLNVDETVIPTLRARASMAFGDPEFVASVERLSVFERFLDVKENLLQEFERFLKDFQRHFHKPRFAPR